MPVDSALHGLDARAKLLAAMLVVCAAVVAGTPLAQAILLAVLLAAFASARLPLGLLGRGVAAALWLLACVALANLVWEFVAQRTGWAHGPTSIHTPRALVVLLFRLFNLLAIGGLFTATTVPVDVAEGLERLLRPLARLGVPVRELGVLFVLALGFVPLLLREAERLSDAHRMKVGARGRRPLGMVRAAVPLLVPLFTGVLRRADELTVALDARGFVPGAPRTSLVPARFALAETAAVLGSAGTLALSVWLS